MSLIQNAGSLVWANYLDVESDVMPWLQIPVGDTQTNTAMLGLVTDFVCQYSQEIMGRPIAPTTFDRRFNGWSGWNGAYLELPYYPILEIVAVTEYWGVSGPHVLEEQTPTNQVDGFQCDYLTGMLTRVFPGLVQKPWFPGSRNIEVSWKAGYNPIPATFKVAALELIAYWWRNTQQASRTFKGGTEYDAMGAAGIWAGLPHRIESVFGLYQQVGLG